MSGICWLMNPYTYAAFLSPSGRGYKVIVRVANNIDNTSHNEYLDALKEYYSSPFWDNCCKGISRACYLSSALIFIGTGTARYGL